MKHTLSTLIVVLVLPCLAYSQYSLKQVSSLGKLKARHMQYFPDDKEWILSDGYSVFKTSADFSGPALLINSYPKYQFQLEKLPNKNLFSRHFDTRSPPFGFEYRANKLDSSSIYIKDNGFKPGTGLLPNAFVKGRILADNSKLRTWAMSNCFLWGKDSTLFCREGVVGVMKEINGRDSVFNIYSNSTFTSFEVSDRGEFIAAGTKDSGWYFIPSASPDRYLRVVTGNGFEISGFYFDDMRKQLWVQENEDWRGFKNLHQYDFSGTVPKLVNSISHETFGLGENEDPIFAFDFKQKKVYVKSVITQLVLFDLEKQTIEAQLSWPGSQLSAINQLCFNKEDNRLYLSAEKFDAANQGDSNFVFRLEKDSQLFSNVITPKNAIDPDNLFPKGMRTAVNKLPGGSFTGMKANISLAKDLALIPNSRSEYLLYNSRSGNMIHSFRGANVDLQISSRFLEENRASLSPDGRYIFEWLIKAGITHGISDTLQVALSNLSSGEIKRNKFLLTSKDDQKILDVAWDEQSRPLFTRISSGTYPEKNIKLFYLDSLLQPHDLAGHNLLKPDVIYDAWNISGTPNVLISTGKAGADKTYHYQLLKKDALEPVTIRSSAANIDVLLNTSGLLFIEENGANKLFAWHNKEGALVHSTTLNAATYRFQSLAKNGHHVYLTDTRTDLPARLDLATGNITDLQSKSKTGYSFAVSPAEDLIFSASDKIEAWQLKGDAMHKLYQLQATKDFVQSSQVSDKHLVSNGRIWSFESGQISHAGLSTISILNDSMYLSTAYRYEVVQDLGFDENYKRTYGLAPHKQLFSKSLSGAKDLRNWYDGFNNILVADRNFSTNTLNNIYELPLKEESFFDVKLYAIPALNSALIIKSPGALFNKDILTAAADTILLLNLATGKLQEQLVGKVVGLKQVSANGAYLFFLLNQKTKALQMYKTSLDNITKINHQVKLTADSLRYTNIVDEDHVVYSIDEGVVFKNLQTGKDEQVRYTYLSGNYINGISLHYDAGSKILYALYDDGGMLKIENKKVVTAVKSMPSAEAFVGITTTYIVTLDKLGNYYFLDKNTLEQQLTLLTWPGNSFADRKFMWLTKENYYMATPGIEKNIHFVNNNNIIPLKQGDLQYNRPDKVLEYLGAAKSEVDFYKEVHQVRMNKYKGIKSSIEEAQSDIQLKVSSIPAGRKIILTVDALAKNNLSRLNVMVNGCPVLIEPLSQKTNRLSQTIEVGLNAGDNNIFTWVEDEKGFSSAYNEQKFIGEFADSGRWHFVGIGVSQYKDSSQNLKYADKDIRDIAIFLSKKYPGIIIDTLLNGQVTRANIQRLAKRLKNTGPDDKVMVSFSGHGLLDTDKKFFYATHDLDFAEPRGGFSMTDITAMLQNITARYRMITLDACHSGDIVQSSNAPSVRVEILPEPPKEAGIKGNILLGAKADKNASKLLRSMQMIFTDQLSNTGINLIAASSGTEFALEGKQWNNGVFTYALLNGWAYGARENISYSQVHYRGLKQYLQQTVSEITRGRQTPNTVMENGEINWWLVPANN